MFELEDLLAVAYKQERMKSRRLAKGAPMPEHDALVITLTKAAGESSLHELVETRRAQQAKAERAAQARKLARSRKPVRAELPAGWTGWFDGSALPNPGRIGIGGVLNSPHGDTVEISAEAGRGDSSAAEYLALIALLEAAHRSGARMLSIYGDSRVVIDDLLMPRDGGIRSLAHHAARARRLMAQIGEVRLQWIPRERNSNADALSRRALVSERVA
jgi:ribonuclease HI